MLKTRTDAVIFALVVMIAGGVREEVQRGFIAHRCDQYLGGALGGVLVYSVFFGAGHADQGFDAMIAIGLLGLCWGLLYIARRSIVAPLVSHVRKNARVAVGLRWINALVHQLERWGWIDARQERLRKSDHLNPLRDIPELEQVAHAAGFRIRRIRYYTPIVGGFVENIMGSDGGCDRTAVRRVASVTL